MHVESGAPFNYALHKILSLRSENISLSAVNRRREPLWFVESSLRALKGDNLGCPRLSRHADVRALGGTKQSRRLFGNDHEFIFMVSGWPCKGHDLLV